MDMTPIVTSRLGARNATLAYADRTIVDKIDVAIPDGKITVIVGPNGCGKSTLLRALARLMTPKDGNVILDGKNIHALPTRVQLAELMRTESSALTQALLALAARKRGRYDWAEYLKRRAGLLVDSGSLIERRPVLRELWDGPAAAPAGGT